MATKSKKSGFSRIRTYACIASVVVAACATERAPTGGIKDLKGPALTNVSPPHAAVNVRPQNVVFSFDKYLEPGDFSKGIFISPLPDKSPEFFTQGKRLFVKFRAPLKDSTTYVFTLGSGLRDYHEKQPFNPPAIYAFSTGPALDTCSVFGKVVDAFSGQPVPDAFVMLYAADSVPDGNYARRRPLYAAQTDSSGQYALRYLRPGRYRIFGIVEKDRNFRYNAPSEKVAFTLDDEWVISQRQNDDGKNTPCTRIANLQAFVPDTFPPKLMSIKPLNERNFLLSFNEPVVDVRIRVDEQKKDSIFLRGSEVRPPAENYIRLYGLESDGPKTVRMPGAAFGRRDTLPFRLWAADTAGMWGDTVLTFVPKISDASAKLTFSRATPPDDAPQTVALVFNSPVSPPFSGIYWPDTSNLKIPATVNPGRSPYEIFISPPPDSLASPRWAIDTSFVSDDGFRLDSLVYEKYAPVALDDFASVSGVASPATVVVFLTRKGKSYSAVPDANGRFSFPYVAAGEYALYAVHDTDGNRRWTPGSVTPRRLPEKVVFHPENLKLRAGWKTENVKLNAE